MKLLPVIGVMLLVLSAPGEAAAGPARAHARHTWAAAGAPGWWDGTCDAGANPGSHPLGASYQGVRACGPGPVRGGRDRLVRFFPGAWGEYEWECVELAMRYMYLVYGVVPYNANGNSVVSNYSGSALAKVANDGSGLPVPGAVLSEAGTGSSSYGHTAVVTAVDVHGGSGTVTVMQEDATADGWGTVPVAGNVLGGGVTGWLRPSGGAGAPPATPSRVDWSFQDLDGNVSSAGRSDTDLGQHPATVVYQGALHVFYDDRQQGTLRHAWYGTGGWHFSVLDGAGGGRGQTPGTVGGAPSAAVDGGLLHVFYYDAAARALRHAWYGRSGWHFGVLDGTGGPGRVSAALVHGGSLHVFYSRQGGVLRHAWRDGSGWHFQSLDGSAGSVAGRQGRRVGGAGGSLAATSYRGELHVFYFAAGPGTLRHAWRDPGGGWHFASLDGGDAGPVSGDADVIGQHPSAVADGGTLHVFAYDATTGDLRHDWRDSSGWHFSNLDGPTAHRGPDRYRVGQYSAATMAGGTLELFYYDGTWGELRHAWLNSAGWHFANLDGLGGQPAGREGPRVKVGLYPSALVYRGARQVFYYGASGGDLRHAWSRPGLAGPALIPRLPRPGEIIGRAAIVEAMAHPAVERDARMLYAIGFERIGVVAGDIYFVDPRPAKGQEGAEHGVRLELRVLDRGELKGSVYSAQPIGIGQPLWRADLLESTDGEPGSFDRTHYHPAFTGWNPSKRVFLRELSADPLGWLGRRLSDLPGLLAEAGAPADTAGQADAGELAAAAPQIVATVGRMLDRVRAGELGKPPDGGPADNIRAGWL